MKVFGWIAIALWVTPIIVIYGGLLDGVFEADASGVVTIAILFGYASIAFPVICLFCLIWLCRLVGISPWWSSPVAIVAIAMPFIFAIEIESMSFGIIGFLFDNGFPSYWLPLWLSVGFICLTWLVKTAGITWSLSIVAALSLATEFIATEFISFRAGNIDIAWGEITIPIKLGYPPKPDYHFDSNGERHREDGPALTRYHSRGLPSAEEWYWHGVLHREDGPALTRYRSSGLPSLEEWFWHGVLHREDGPAVTQHSLDGQIIREAWYQNGGFHREDGPALTRYHSSGLPSLEEWFWHGVLHREDGSAVTQYSLDGQIIREAWYQNGELHREKTLDVSLVVTDTWYQQGIIHRDNGPAVIRYKSNGEPIKKWWYQNGEIHRDDGPAYTWYLDYGVKEEWYSHGTKIPPPANGN